MPETNCPKLVDLPVYRSTYLDQQRVNELCALLWKERPDLVAGIAESTGSELADRDVDTFADINMHVIAFFQEKIQSKNTDPISMTGMVDLIFEIDRRIRKALGFTEIQIIGNSIADSPLGPYPSVVSVPVRTSPENIAPFRGLTHEKLDRLTQQAYNLLISENPEVIFAFVELLRRHLRRGVPDIHILDACKRVAAKEEGVSGSDIKLGFGHRLFLTAKEIETKKMEMHNG